MFISWSGDISRQVAEVFRSWLPSVIQVVRPYVSSEDIDKGARWSADISRELEDSNYGILCVTRENLAAPWLNFEAGALSKSFDKSHVSPFLFQIDRNDVQGPLLQFQSTIFDKDDVLKLARSINTACDPCLLDENRLDSIFAVWWPTLEKQLNGIVSGRGPQDNSVQDGKRSVENILDEVLTLVRSQQKIISDPAELLPRGYIEHVLRTTDRIVDGPIEEILLDLFSTWRALKSEVDRLSDTIPTDDLASLMRMVRNLGSMITFLTESTGSRRRATLRKAVRPTPAD